MSKQRIDKQPLRAAVAAPTFTSADAWAAKASIQSAPARTVALRLPSGAVVEARRPPLDAWIASGKLPQALTQASLAAAGEEAAATNAAPAGEDNALEIVNGFIAMGKLVAETVVNPRIVLESPGPGEILAAAIPDQDFAFLMHWIISGAPDVPVAMANGKEVSVDALAGFRDDEARRAPARTGDD